MRRAAIALVIALLLPAASAHAVRVSPTTFGVGSGAAPGGVGMAPDGSEWFTDLARGLIGRIDASGHVQEFDLPQGSRGAEPNAIVAGSDGNMWFTERHGVDVGRITPTGTITEFTVPSAQPPDEFGLGRGPEDIAAGSDGALWFTEPTQHKLGRITTAGSVSELDLSGRPRGIAAGPDGNLWVTLDTTVARVTPPGAVTEFPVASAAVGVAQRAITAGHDGNLYFSTGSAIVRLTTAGAMTALPLERTRITTTPAAQGLAATADGSIWFTDPSEGFVGRLDAGGAITYFPVFGAQPTGIAAGANDTVWFSELAARALGRLPLSGQPAPIPAFASPPKAKPRTIRARGPLRLTFRAPPRWPTPPPDLPSDRPDPASGAPFRGLSSGTYLAVDMKTTHSRRGCLADDGFTYVPHRDDTAPGPQSVVRALRHPNAKITIAFRPPRHRRWCRGRYTIALTIQYLFGSGPETDAADLARYPTASVRVR